MSTMKDDRLVFNGIDGATGKYLLPPMTPWQIAAIAQGEAVPEKWYQQLLTWWHAYTSQDHLGPASWVDPKKLEEAGWGVIFAESADPAIEEALEPLLELRREQASQLEETFYRKLVFHPKESKRDFLSRYNIATGHPADPHKLPYYLLIVGSPKEIPFSFQYQLDVEYAVGRIHFKTTQEYANYARGVVEVETGSFELPHRATFFGVRNPDDRATELSHDHLVGPLARSLAARKDGWSFKKFMAEDASKARLIRLLGGDPKPALLFTASHGVGFSKDHQHQRSHQGALVCQDWGGPKSVMKTVPCVAGNDIPCDADLEGLLLFHLACFSAGTPKFDSFSDNPKKQVTSEAFVASLPQRLLGHCNGGALAVVGHVDRAWTHSFFGLDTKAQIKTYESMLWRLLDGHPVGSAMESFSQRYAALSCELQDELEAIGNGKEAKVETLARLWAERNDARSFIVLGDPAVRLPSA